MAPTTVIEFSETECKVGQAERSKGKPSVKTLFAFELPPNDDIAARTAQRAHLLKEALRANKLKQQSVTVVIPKNYVMSRLVTLPSTDEEELVGMARFEADRHIPFNAERHVVSHAVLNKQGMQGSQVLLAAIDQPVAREYLDVCLGAGLHVERLTVSTVTLFNAFVQAHPDEFKDKVVALVNIGASHIDLCIVNNGVLTFSRSATVGVGKLISEINEADGGGDFSTAKLSEVDAREPHLYFRATGSSPYDPTDTAPPHPMPRLTLTGNSDPNPGSVSGLYPSLDPVAIAEPGPSIADAGVDLAHSVKRMLFTNWLLRLLQEVKKTYEYARREFNVPMIDHIFLCGDGAVIRNLPQYFNVNFNVATEVFDPLKYVEIAPKVAKNVEGRAPAFANVIGGIGVGERAILVNLLPSEYLEEKQTKRQQRSYITTGVLALLAVVLGYVYLSGVFQGRTEELANLQLKNQQMQSSVDDLKAKELRLEIIKTHVRDEHGALDILEKLSSLPFIPENVSVKEFRYDKSQSTIRISGYAREVQHINRFEAALEEMGVFEAVDIDPGSNKQTNLKNRGQTKVYEYIITAKFPVRKVKKSTSSDSAANEEDSDGA